MIGCRYCHKEALKSFNDEPVCANCFDGLTNRQKLEDDKEHVYDRTEWHKPTQELISSKEWYSSMGMDENGRYPVILKKELPMERREENPDFNINEENDPEYRLA